MMMKNKPYITRFPELSKKGDTKMRIFDTKMRISFQKRENENKNGIITLSNGILFPFLRKKPLEIIYR